MPDSSGGFQQSSAYELFLTVRLIEILRRPHDLFGAVSLVAHDDRCPGADLLYRPGEGLGGARIKKATHCWHYRI